MKNGKFFGLGVLLLSSVGFCVEPVINEIDYPEIEIADHYNFYEEEIIEDENADHQLVHRGGHALGNPIIADMAVEDTQDRKGDCSCNEELCVCCTVSCLSTPFLFNLFVKAWVNSIFRD